MFRFRRTLLATFVAVIVGFTFLNYALSENDHGILMPTDRRQAKKQKSDGTKNPLEEAAIADQQGPSRRAPIPADRSKESDDTPSPPADRIQKSSPESNLAPYNDNSPLYLKWGPLVLSDCPPQMQDQSAPCLKKRIHPNTNLVEAHELIYRPFRLRLPVFLSDRDKEIWLQFGRKIDRMHISVDEKWADYPTYYGQNLVFANAKFNGRPVSDVWSEEACVGYQNSHAPFVTTTGSDVPQSFDYETLILANSPDSFSFQHFTDRVTVIWSQAKLLVKSPEEEKATVILSGAEPNNPTISDMYDVMGFKHIHNKVGATAKKLIYSCRVPLVHPYSTQKFSLTVAEKLNIVDKPFNERKIILYCSRSNGDAANGGRTVVNEDELIAAIKAMLVRRGQNEELVMHVRSKYENLSKHVQMMRNVKAIIGPHGGALYHGRFAPPGTIVCEIVPYGGYGVTFMFWEQSRMLEQNYIAYIADEITGKSDIVMRRVNEFVTVLEAEMNAAPNYKPTDFIVPEYHWEVKYQ